MDDNNSNDVTIYLLLIIASVLVLIDSLELYNLFITWTYSLKFQDGLFSKCLQWEIITKTVLSSFSLIAAFSSFLLTFCLIVCQRFFLTKILSSYLYLNYTIFGPFMLGFSLIGFYNWEYVAYSCDKDSLEKIYNPSNVFSISGCFVVSLLVTMLVAIYNTSTLYFESLSNNSSNGSRLLKHVFWYTAVHSRSSGNNTNVQNGPIGRTIGVNNAQGQAVVTNSGNTNAIGNTGLVVSSGQCSDEHHSSVV